MSCQYRPWPSTLCAAMSPTNTRKSGGRLYRYYYSQTAMKRGSSRACTRLKVVTVVQIAEQLCCALHASRPQLEQDAHALLEDLVVHALLESVEDARS